VIIERYLIREITQPFVMGSVMLVVVFASYSSADYLADAAAGLIAADTVLTLILLKTLISFEILLPTALYLSVVVGLGRLHTDSEMTAITASGISDLRVLKAVFRLALLVAVLVGLLSIFTRPWAYRQAYDLEARAVTQFDLSKLEAGRFYALKRANHVLFAEGIDAERNRLEDVFFQGSQGDSTRVIFASEAYPSSVGEDATPAMVFVDGYAYQLDRHGRQDSTLAFGTLTVHLAGYRNQSMGYKRRAEPTSRLARSERPKDIAEFQWRMTAPIAVVLLATLAVPLSRTAPRRGRYAKLFLAVLIYAVYYNLGAMARTWVEEGWVGPLPGIWWVHALPLCMLGLLLWRPVWRLRWNRA